MVKEDWDKDYPDPKIVKADLENLPAITLTLENKHNKYWEWKINAERQSNRQNTELKKLTNILKNYYTKKPLSDEIIEKYSLPPLQVNYSNREIDLLVKSDDRYCELEEKLADSKALIKYLDEILGLITGWKWHQQQWIVLYRIKHGHTNTL